MRPSAGGREHRAPVNTRSRFVPIAAVAGFVALSMLVAACSGSGSPGASAGNTAAAQPGAVQADAPGPNMSVQAAVGQLVAVLQAGIREGTITRDAGEQLVGLARKVLRPAGGKRSAEQRHEFDLLANMFWLDNGSDQLTSTSTVTNTATALADVAIALGTNVPYPYSGTNAAAPTGPSAEAPTGASAVAPTASGLSKHAKRPSLLPLAIQAAHRAVRTAHAEARARSSARSRRGPVARIATPPVTAAKAAIPVTDATAAP